MEFVVTDVPKNAVVEWQDDEGEARVLAARKGLLRRWLHALLEGLPQADVRRIDVEDAWAYFGEPVPSSLVPFEVDSPALQRALKRVQVKWKKLPPAADPLSLVPGARVLAEGLGLPKAAARVLAVLALRDADSEFCAALSSLRLDDSRRVLSTLAGWAGVGLEATRQCVGEKGVLATLRCLVSDDGEEPTLEDAFALSPTVRRQMLSPQPSLRDLLSGVFRSTPAACLSATDYPHLSEVLPIWTAYLRSAMAQSRPGVNLLIYGPPGAGKTELARVLAASVEAELFEVVVEDSDGDPRGAREILQLSRAAQIALKDRSHSLMLIDEADAVFESAAFDPMRRSGTSKAWTIEMLETAATPTIWVANEMGHVHPAILRRFDLVLQMDSPPTSVRRHIVEHHLGSERVPTSLRQELSENPHLQAGHVAMLGRMLGALPQGVSAAQAIRQQHAALQELLGLPPPRALMRSSLGEFDTRFLNADRPIDEVIARVIERGAARIVLYGPPGTGKTAFGLALAKALDRPLQHCTSADLLSKWIGDTERNIVDAFARASREGNVLMLDEVDSLLMCREDADRQWQVSQVNELLNALDHFAGVVVLTTNRFDALDRAVLRRLDLKLQLRAPTPEQRIALWRQLCAQQQWAVDEADCLRLRGLDGLTPGDFHLVARQYLDHHEPKAKADALRDLQQEWQIKQGNQRVVGFAAPNAHFHA